MRRLINVLVTIAFAAGLTLVGGQFSGEADGDRPHLRGRILAVGIPNPSAITPVGNFLPGGPIHDNPAFAAYTQPGRILDPIRILVGSSSNFGASVANRGEQEGSFISIDPSGTETLEIPRHFASAGGQASALGGRVQMFSAQSPAFLNGVNNPLAVTAGFAGVSNPLGISINNAFGRIWPANAPDGLDRIGTSTILDPTGIPLAGAPNPQAGGVFAGNLTPRLPSQVLAGGLRRGAVGTAFLGRAPDGSGRAVFAVVLADGSIIQAHTAQAVDGLAPAGAVSPLVDRRRHDSDDRHDGRDDDDARISMRLGVVLNYIPTRILYISEPLEDRIVVLDLIDDGVVFRVGGVRRFHSEALNQPIDLAPAEIETSNPNWSSNTTLERGADFYIANRGDNTIVRMRQDGRVVAVRRVRLADGRSLGEARLNGIAASPDGSRIWVTITGRLPGWGHLEGAVLELPAFQD